MGREIEVLVLFQPELNVFKFNDSQCFQILTKHLLEALEVARKKCWFVAKILVVLMDS